MGGYGSPGSLRGDANPQRDCPGVCGERCEWCGHECAGVRASQRAVCERDPVCEWCGGECARMRASQHAVCERGTASGRGHCAPETARVSEQPGVSEARCVRGTACVRSLYVREMTVGMREHAAASPGVSVMEWCVSVVTRRCAWVERRRRRQMDKCRVAAVAVLGTAPGLHGGEREVWAVQRTRPPRARLRE